MARQSQKVLLVDDDPGILNLWARQLKEAGHSPYQALDSVEAMELLRKKEGIGLVVLDLILPKISGLDIFDRIKREFPKVKVIIASVYPRDDQEFFIQDATDYYYKSEDIDILIEKIRQHLGS